MWLILVEVFPKKVISFQHRFDFFELQTGWEGRFLYGFSLFGFVWNAKRFAIAYVLLLAFFCQSYLGLLNYKSIFLILKISQYVELRQWVQLFPRYPRKNWCKNWCKNWYLHFCKTYDHQIWQSGTSTRFDSNETNKTGASDVITSR